MSNSSTSNHTLRYYLYDSNSVAQGTNSYAKGKSGADSYKLALNETYYLQILHSSKYSSCKGDDYTLTVSCEQDEPDSRETATQIDLNQLYTGQIFTKLDEDWFKFATPGYVANYTISISNLYTSTHDVKYILYDDNSVNKGTSSYAKAKSGTDNYKLEPNKTYYLQILHTNKHSSCEGDDYTLMVSCEQEEPDSRETATQIELNESNEGQIFTESDEDWFKFTTSKYNMIYSIQTSNLSENAGRYGTNNQIGYRIYDADKNCIFEKHLKKLENDTSELKLKAGKTYYIQFYNYKYYKEPYSYSFKLNEADILSLDTPAAKVSATSKGFTVKWGKVKNASGYEIRYSTKKSMKSAKKVTVTSKSKKITKLKAKAKYYVQVRAYAKLSTGKKLYSKWSSKSTVTTKK
jgi:hypothetical protein